MSYAQQQPPARRLGGVAFVALLHVGIVYALLTGLGRQAIEVLKLPLETKIIQELKAPPPDTAPPPPKLAPPLTRIEAQKVATSSVTQLANGNRRRAAGSPLIVQPDQNLGRVAIN